ncbi:hypothetical protein ACH5RR_003085 [Cinchona calisaya]|uniref:VQ domain-containing protein n=1 Tax=Cinchona calisaya TaxID=153742 RepID=A0ABD3ATY1_9GENT
MDKILSVQHKKANKQPKNKIRPVKVVYISNPMKVKTSASEFRALVQELTGKDADVPGPTKFSDKESAGSGIDGREEVSTELKSKEDDYVRKGMHKRADCNLYETYDHKNDDVVFTPWMMESFPGLVASNLWYGSTTRCDELKSHDIV